MNRRHFLKSLSAVAAALLVAPKAVLKELSTFRALSGRSYYFAHTWDGSTRRTWIDGEEVFGESVQNCGGVTISDDFYQVSGMDQGSISFWIAPPDEVRYFDGAIDEVKIHDTKIPWMRLSDDLPFEPPLRTDLPPVIDSDIGEGEHLIDSWW